MSSKLFQITLQTLPSQQYVRNESENVVFVCEDGEIMVNISTLAQSGKWFEKMLNKSITHVVLIEHKKSDIDMILKFIQIGKGNFEESSVVIIEKFLNTFQFSFNRQEMVLNSHQDEACDTSTEDESDYLATSSIRKNPFASKHHLNKISEMKKNPKSRERLKKSIKRRHKQIKPSRNNETGVIKLIELDKRAPISLQGNSLLKEVKINNTEVIVIPKGLTGVVNMAVRETPDHETDTNKLATVRSNEQVANKMPVTMANSNFANSTNCQRENTEISILSIIQNEDANGIDVVNSIAEEAWNLVSVGKSKFGNQNTCELKPIQNQITIENCSHLEGEANEEFSDYDICIVEEPTPFVDITNSQSSSVDEDPAKKLYPVENGLNRSTQEHIKEEKLLKGFVLEDVIEISDEDE